MCDVFATEHADSVTDVAVDPTGRLLATASEDRTIKIWSPSEPAAGSICTLEGHENAVLRVAWGPSKFGGSPLLSLGSDNRVILWKDTSGSGKGWSQVYSRQFSSGLVSCAWAPQEYSEMFACCCDDGKVHIVSKGPQDWSASFFDAHPSAGCTGISWAPCLPPSGLLQLPFSKQQQQQQTQFNMPFPRLVTSGNERSLRIWRYAPQDKSWVQETELTDMATRCITDVSWSPNVGLPFSYIAAGTDEGEVGIWLQDGFDGRWKATQLPPLSDPVSRVSWSSVGTFLLVTCENASVSMWKEGEDGVWQQVSTVCNGES